MEKEKKLNLTSTLLQESNNLGNLIPISAGWEPSAINFKLVYLRNTWSGTITMKYMYKLYTPNIYEVTYIIISDFYLELILLENQGAFEKT